MPPSRLSATAAQAGPLTAAVHPGPGDTKIHEILRVFDLTAKYGPCAGMTRLERWNRAKRWGLDPPEDVSAGYGRAGPAPEMPTPN